MSCYPRTEGHSSYICTTCMRCSWHCKCTPTAIATARNNTLPDCDCAIYCQMDALRGQAVKCRLIGVIP